MSTTSTLPVVKAALVGLLDTGLATSSVSGGQVPVFYQWTGDAADEMVFLGRREEDGPRWSSLIDSDIATIKAGRKQRQEVYTLELTVWSWRGDVQAEGAAEAETRAFELLAKVEDVLANDPKLGLSNVIQWAKVRTIEEAGEPFDNGWRITFLLTLEVNARLT